MAVTRNLEIELAQLMEGVAIWVKALNMKHVKMVSTTLDFIAHHAS